MVSLAIGKRQQSVLRWSEAVRVHDLDLYRHSARVCELTATFSTYLGLSRAEQQELTLGALLHDIGKTKIPVELLHKPADLTAMEQVQMRTHAEIGYAMLEAEGCYSTIVLSIVRHHHERIDGTGYPQGLAETAISDGVRIVTLCDIYAALTEERSYSIPLAWNAALECMATKSGGLDLQLLVHFTKMIEVIHQPWVSSLVQCPEQPHMAARGLMSEQIRKLENDSLCAFVEPFVRALVDLTDMVVFPQESRTESRP